MTVQEMVEEVFEMLTEPSDLEVNVTPKDSSTFSLALPGALKILRYLNQAQARIANWKFADETYLRFKNLYDRIFWKSKDPIVQLALSSGTDSVVIAGLTTNVDTEFDGWVCEITDGIGVGQVRIVVSSLLDTTNIELTMERDWDTALDTTSEVTLYKSFADFKVGTEDYLTYHIALNNTTGISDVLKIRDLIEQSELGRSQYQDTYPAIAFTAGTPTEFYVFGKRLQFNAAMSENRSFEILYYRNPVLLSVATQECELPLAFHDAVCMYAVHKLMTRAQDFDGQYAVKRNLVDLMNGLRQQGVLTNEMEQGSIMVWG